MNYEERLRILEEAGFTDDDGRLGKLVATGTLIVPNTINLDAEKGELVSIPFDGGTEVRLPRHGPLLNEFIRLGDEPSGGAILRFARKWGMLYLDAKGTPCSNPWDLLERRREPLSAWKYFSRRARAAFTIAGNLADAGHGHAHPDKKAKRASPDDWAALDGLGGRPGVEPRVGTEFFDDLNRRYGVFSAYAALGHRYRADWTIEKERRALAREIRIWLDLGRPSFAVSMDTWQLEVDYNGCLLSAIALQLALAATGMGHLFMCSGCGYPYVRLKWKKGNHDQSRKMKDPKPGEKNFCPECSKRGTPLREANKRVQERKEEVRRRHAEGATKRELIREFNIRSTKRSTAMETVSRWIGKDK
jgi:hypothetical protein